MKIFSNLYQRVIEWSRHKYAPYYLFAVSFAESSFFPIPPDVMLAPMSLARPTRAWDFALITTLASVLGGLLGYLIGYFGYETIVEPIIQTLGYQEQYDKLEEYFKLYGIWIVFIAGFSPIPYKLITIAAGALNMALLPFILISIIGRGKRFYLVAGLMRWGGQRFEKYLYRFVDWIGWGMVALCIVGIVFYKLGLFS